MDYNEFRAKEYERRDQRLRQSQPMRLCGGGETKERLHIVYVMTWTGICGGSKIIFQHCNRLARRGHRITVLCHLPRPEWFPLDEGVAFIQPAFGEVLGAYIPPCDLVVATYWKEIYECVEQNRAPVAYFEQGDIHLFDPESMDPAMLAHARRQIELAPFVFTVSGFAADTLSERFGVRAEVIPNAVDRAVFYPDPAGKRGGEPTVVATIGPDYIPFKRIPDILAAVAALRAKGYPVQMRWITPGLSALAETEGARVNPPQDEIGDILRCADIYVCASQYESFCLPVLEAMSCGAAVVTTDCGGVRDFAQDGETALFASPGAEGLARQLERLINDPELRRKLSENGLRAAARFDWERVTDRLETYYRELASYKIAGPASGPSEVGAIHTVSLCMIVKDEERVLARCLDSVRDAVDEIVIVDTGSTDGTKEIAKRYTDKVFDFEWVDDFSAARNFAFSKATMDWQMWLDADDVLPEGELPKLLALKATLDPGADIVTARYVTHFDEQGVPVHFSTRERLIRREKGYTWLGPVHECIPLVGNVVPGGFEIHHRKMDVKEGQQTRNLRIYEALEQKGAPLDPRSQYYFARELRDHGYAIKAAYYFEKFLAGGMGWVEDNIAACFSLAQLYARLGDRERILPILFKSFTYAPPRAEVCCELGYYYKHAKDFAAALQWFRIAASMELPQTQGFVLVDYYGYIPHIESCVCCFELGDFDASHRHNEQAALHKPDSPAIELNRSVLKGRVSA